MFMLQWEFSIIESNDTIILHIIFHVANSDGWCCTSYFFNISSKRPMKSFPTDGRALTLSLFKISNSVRVPVFSRLI
jgi:hypothetical protein